MSKYTSIINTFKNGMVSPRLRGSISAPEDKSAVEQLENFIVDRTGSAIKRAGLLIEDTEAYVAGLQHFTFDLVNTANANGTIEYTFRFNPNVSFTAVDASYDSTYLTINGQGCKTFGSGVQSKYISLHSFSGADITLLVDTGHGFLMGDTISVSGLVNTTNSPNGLQTVTSVDATHVYYTHSAIPTGASTIASTGAYVGKHISGYVPSSTFLWNGHYDTTGNGVFNESGLTTYLDTSLTIIQARQISDRTVAFTSDRFSFFVSVLDYPTSTQTIRQFYMYPYFVSGNILATNLGKFIGDNVKCPIVPSNFPFNPINTDPSLIVNTTAVPSQAGAVVADALLLKSLDEQITLVTVQRSMTFVNGSSVSLTGRFISIPIATSGSDVIFFLTKENATTATTIQYKAIQVTGGVALNNATTWKLSTWGDDGHPRAVGYAFRRLIYGNIPTNPSGWWSSAIHPNNLLYKQGFMTTNLLQDASSDVSGINFAGVTIASITTPTTLTAVRDIFRFGFNDVVPSLGAIGFISSRRSIHFGTSNGENQINISDGTYSAASYSQNIISTSEADLLNISEGDRKIFYISNNGKDIRAISTEDKDYESLDTLISVPLEGLGLKFTKIEWVESIHALLCFTSTSRLFVLSMHTDTKIRAFSEIKSLKTILDFTGLRVYLKDGSNTLNTKMHQDLTSNGATPAALQMYGDLFTYSIGSYPDFTQYFSTTVYIVIITDTGVFSRTTFAVPSSGAGDFSLLPIAPGALTTQAVYIHRDLMTCKLKTLPIHEGGKFGTSVGDIQRVDRIAVLTDSSGNFSYGTSSSVLMSAETITTVAPYTKIVALDFPQSPDREQPIYIESSEATPLNISGISIRGVSYSGE